MLIPQEMLARLYMGRLVAAELPVPQPGFRAFVVVLPQVPDLRTQPEAWAEGDWDNRLYREPTLRSPSFIRGYEVRYLLHHAKYTNSEWGWDYDHVLADKTTRVQRMFVEREDEVEAAVTKWLPDVVGLQAPGNFDSSLVNSPLNYYLDNSEGLSHLWLL